MTSENGMVAAARTDDDSHRELKRWQRRKVFAVLGAICSAVGAGYACWVFWAFGSAAGVWVPMSAAILLVVSAIVLVASVSVLRVPLADRQRRAAVRARTAKLTFVAAVLTAPMGAINLWYFVKLGGLFSLVVGIALLLGSAATATVAVRRLRGTR
jgi:hypothetical protein